MCSINDDIVCEYTDKSCDSETYYFCHENDMQWIYCNVNEYGYVEEKPKKGIPFNCVDIVFDGENL